ncbi:MAG: hypothetical protein WD029_00295 [Microthrixaceae bacterium]
MKQSVRTLLVLLLAASGTVAFSHSALAATSGSSSGGTTCTGRLISIRINALEDSSTTPDGSDFDVTGQVIAIDREALGLAPGQDIDAVIDFIGVFQNGDGVRTITASDGFFRGVVSVLEAESTVSVEVSIDSGDDLEELTCEVDFPGASRSETTTTTTTAVTTTTTGGGAVPTTTPTSTVRPSVKGVNATAAPTPAAVQGELALTASNSWPLAILGISMAALGFGLLLAERKLRLR